jgi:hypothetical protein
MLQRSTGTNRYIRGLHLTNGTARPGVYIDIQTTPDYGGWVDEVLFGALSASNGVAYITCDSLVNLHCRGLRFGGGEGYGIEITDTGGSTNRSLSLEEFTMDTAETGWKGIVHIVGVSGTQYGVELANARIESGAAWTAPGALVVVESDPANDLGLYPLDVTLRNLQIAVTSGLPSLVHQETTQTSVSSNVVLENIRYSPAPTAVLGGNWAITIPQVPGVSIRHWSIGRFQSGGTKHNREQLSSLSIGGDGATAVTQHISATASLDFGSIAAGADAELTITATGAATGDNCYASPTTTLESGLVWSAWVSAANIVRIRVANYTTGAIDPAART